MENKLIYFTLKKAPKATISAPKKSKEAKTSKEGMKVSTEVAKTMTKLNLLLPKLDKKVAHAKKKFLNYRWMEKKKGPKWAKKRAEWWNKYQRLIKMKNKAVKINEQFQNIEEVKNKKYTKVAMETLNSLNDGLDKAAKGAGIDLRGEILKNLAEKAFEDILVSEYSNLAVLTNVFSMMNDSDKPIKYKGLTVQKKGQKITLTYKGEKREYTVGAGGENLNWEIKDKDGKKVRHNPKPLALSGIFTGTDIGFSVDAQQNYYRSKSAVNAYANVKGMVPEKAKVVKKAPKKTPAQLKAAKEAEAKQKLTKELTGIFTSIGKLGINEQVKGATLVKLKTIDSKVKANSYVRYPKGKNKSVFAFSKSTDGKFLRITMKSNEKTKGLKKSSTQYYISIAENFKVVNPAKIGFEEDIKFAADPLNKKEVFKTKKVAKKAPKKTAPAKPDKNIALLKKAQGNLETKENKDKMTKWGKGVAKNIEAVRKTLTSANLTVSMAFLKAVPDKNISAKQKVLNKYRYQLGEVAKKIKADKGENIPKYVNELAKAYKLIPKALANKPLIKDKVMVTISKPPLQVALNISMMKKDLDDVGNNKLATYGPAPKKVVAQVKTNKKGIAL